MTFTLWFLIAGGLLIFMALAGSVLKRLPLSAAMVYLAVELGLWAVGDWAYSISMLCTMRR